MILAQRIASHTHRAPGIRAGSASHPSGTLGTNLEVLIVPSQLDEDSWSFCENQFGTFDRNTKYIARVSFATHFFP